MKKIEFIFSDLCNIYGEAYNMEYLGRCNSEIEILHTSHKNTPYFANNSVDMIYMGCLTERKQEETIQLLMPYKERIRELIDNDTIFLVTGNAIEIFGREIKDEERIIPALGIFDFKSERYMDVPELRHNSQYVGEFRPEGEAAITMLGHKSQFSFAYGEFPNPFIDVEIGIGMNPDIKKEGIWFNNFYGTYSLGPYFILNPLFAKYLLRKMGLDDSLVFEKEIMEAYEYRLKELRENLG